MEFTKTQIAGLVLGYLKSEQCFAAFNAFVDGSQYLQNNGQVIKAGKCFPTRVAGKCLIDYLEEYANIYSIVQGRLEASNYYNEKHTNGGLLEQILYLLDNAGIIENSSPILCNTSEVNTTPAHALPGNNACEDVDSAFTQKTPKRKSSRNRNNSAEKTEKNDVLEVSGLLAQSLLGNQELQEKLAQTINIVRSTPEVVRIIPDDISAGASKELDAVIKAVVQKTEEDPIYNRLIDEIIGNAPVDTLTTAKKQNQISQQELQPSLESKLRPSQKPADKSTPSSTIDDLNNEAVRSIIAASQSTDEGTKPSGEVYVFDGSLDTYLKSTGTSLSSIMPPNPVYFNTGSLIMVPPYVVNQQPLLNVKNVITDADIMTMPTVIVNDEPEAAPKPRRIAPKKKLEKKPKAPVTKRVAPAAATDQPRPPSAVRNLDFSTPHSRGEDTTKNSLGTWDADLRSLAGVADKKEDATPKRKRVINTRSKAKKTTPKSKDFEDSSITKKKPETANEDKKEDTEPVESVAQIETEKIPDENVKKTDVIEPEKETEISPPVILDTTPPEKNSAIDVPTTTTTTTASSIPAVLETPLKDMIPKTPGFGSSFSLQCTPMSQKDVEEHLKGLDLISMPTPQFPITPGFSLTPALELGYSHRSTDYSTSSSYYQPSDTEQNKSIEQLVEETRKFEETQTEKTQDDPKFSKLRILSDVVIEHGRLEIPPVFQKPKDEEAAEPVKVSNNVNCTDVLKNFNNCVIGKKNLNLIPSDSSSTSTCSEDSDSSTESDSDHSSSKGNKTVICKEEPKTEMKKEDSSATLISEIISTVEVVNPVVGKVDNDTKQSLLLSQLEEKRQNMIKQITKKPAPIRKSTRVSNKDTVKTYICRNLDALEADRKRKIAKRNGTYDRTDEEAQKTVKGLAARGIHLIHNKTPSKNDTPIQEDTSTKETAIEVVDNTPLVMVHIPEDEDQVPTEPPQVPIIVNSEIMENKEKKESEALKSVPSIKEETPPKIILEPEKPTPKKRTPKCKTPAVRKKRTPFKKKPVKRLRILSDSSEESHTKIEAPVSIKCQVILSNYNEEQHEDVSTKTKNEEVEEGEIIEDSPRPKKTTKSRRIKTPERKKSEVETRPKVPSKVISLADTKKERNARTSSIDSRKSDKSERTKTPPRRSERAKTAKTPSAESKKSERSKSPIRRSERPKRGRTISVESNKSGNRTEKESTPPVASVEKSKTCENPSKANSRRKSSPRKVDRSKEKATNKTKSPKLKKSKTPPIKLIKEPIPLNIDKPKTEAVDKIAPVSEQFELNLSSISSVDLDLSTYDEPVFDTQVFDSYEYFLFDESEVSAVTRKSLKDYDFECLKKKQKVVVFPEVFKERVQVERLIQWTDLHSLTPSTPKTLQSPLVKNGPDDDLMDYAVVGSVREVTPEPPPEDKLSHSESANKGVKKRKRKLSDEGEYERKCRKLENINLKLLKKVDVDAFLDQVHGE